MLVLAATRLIRGWNQTGQKYAGEPDIVKTFITPNPGLLWVLLGAVYLWIGRDLVAGFSGLTPAAGFIISTVLVLAAFTFKLAFTHEDAPELVGDFTSKMLDTLPASSLVARAQAVFAGLAIATGCVIFSIFSKFGKPARTTGK